MTSTSTVFNSTVGGRLEGTPGSIFSAWEITTPAPAFHGSYGYNCWVFGGFSNWPRSTGGRLVGLNVFSIEGRADIPVLLDATIPWVRVMTGVRPPYSEQGGVEIGNFCMNRHNGFVNGLFLDWSARRVGLKELWTLYWYWEFDRAGPWTRAGGMTPERWPQWMRSFKDY